MAIRRLSDSYRAKLVLGYAAVVVLFAVSWAWSLYGPVTESLTSQQERSLVSIASAGSVLVSQGVGPALAAEVLHEAEGVRVTIVAADGTVLADSDENTSTMENHGDRPEVASALQGKVGTAQRVSRTAGSEQMYAAVPGRIGGVPVAVRASETVADMASVVANARRAGVVLLVLALVLASALASYVSRGLAEPVERLSSAATQMARGDLGADIPTPSGELGVLADALRDLRTQIRLRIADLESERAVLRSALDGLGDGVLLVEGGLVTYANSAAGRMFPSQPMQWTGRSIAETALPTSLAARISELLVQDAVTSEETEPDPTGMSVRLATVPLGPSEGLSRALVVIADNTERARLERMRRDFVANVSHELKTPVSGIQLLAESAAHAAEDGDDAQALAFATQIARESTRLRQLVSDLLDLSRLEASPAAGSLTDLRDAAANAVSTHVTAAESRGLYLRLEDDAVAGDDVFALADPTDVAVALDNLLENAIAHTDTGGVVVRLKATSAEVSLEVADTGVGMAQKELPRIFERFYRIDAARSRENGGTGLGLALVRNAVERSGGRVSVVSELGKGSTFTVAFNRAR